MIPDVSLHDPTTFGSLLGGGGTTTTYHHHGILVNGQMLICNDSQIDNCVKQCARVFQPIDQRACVSAVEAKFAPYSKCFSGDCTVFVKGSKPVRLDKLKVGQEIMDANMRFTKVVGWLHMDPNIETDFVQIQHSTGSLLVTSDHLLYCSTHGDYIPSRDVKSLEVVYIDGTLTSSEIKHKSVVRRRGIYAPLTASGSFLVNGVHASCYASPGELSVEVTQAAGNLALAPFRLLPHSILPELDSYCKSLYWLFVS